MSFTKDTIVEPLKMHNLFNSIALPGPKAMPISTFDCIYDKWLVENPIQLKIW